MNMKKRFTALLLAVIICIGIFPCAGFADEIPNDEYIGLMYALDIITPGKITADNADLPISRVDFAVFVSKLLGISEGLASDNNYFYDVPEDHWGKSSINALVERKIIAVGDRYFRPDDAITRAEAAKMAVVVIGRDLEAYLKGGFPNGYMRVANSLDLFRNISDGEELTYKDAAVLLYNTAIEEVVYVTTTNDDTSFKKSGETILSLDHGVDFGEGIVSAVDGVSIDNTDTSHDKVIIGDIVFNANDWYYDYLGRNVKYFYKDDGIDKNIIYIMDESKDEDVITINSKDYIGYDDGNISYWKSPESARISKIKIYQGATVIRNGEKANGDMMNALDKNNIYGTIRIVDTGRYDGADVIIIEDYENIVVSYVDDENKIVYSKDNALDPLMLGDADSMIVKYFTADGMIADFSEISVGNVISVAASTDGKFAIVRLRNKEVSGIISGMSSNDNGEAYLIIDGVTYNIERTFYEKNKNSISVGSSDNFCLDAFGNIVSFVVNKSDDMQYACLADARIITEPLIGDRVFLKLFTASGELVTVPCAEKIKIDSEVYSDAGDVIEYFSSYGEIQAKGIRVQYDKNGDIKTIDTPVLGLQEGEYSLRRINTVDSAYYHWTGLFGNFAYMPADVPLMLVPPKASIKIGNIDDFAIKTRAVLTASETYNIDFLTTDPNSRIPEIAICYKENVTEATDTSTFYVVEEVMSALNADGIEVPSLTLDDSGESDYLVSADYGQMNMGAWEHVNPNTLTAGDIVRISVNIAGEIVDIRLVFDYSIAKENTNTSFFENAVNPIYKLNENSMVGANYDTVTGYGYVGKKDGTVFEWGFNTPLQTNQIYSSDIQSSTLKVMIFDDKKRSDKCTNGTTNDLISYEESQEDFSKIVTMQRDKVLSKMVIYK